MMIKHNIPQEFDVIITRLVRWAAACTSLMIACGCAGGESGSFLQRHIDGRSRESAVKKWENVRGDVTLQLAQQHFRAGRLKDAESALARVMALGTESSEVYKFAAMLYIELGQLARAQEAVVAAARMPGYDAETEYLAGIIAQRYGAKDRALSHYKTALQMSPNVPEFVLATAEMYVSLDQPEKAMELIQIRIRDFDGSAAMAVLAAQIARILDRSDDAVTFCREALHDNADDPIVRAELGEILVWAGRYAEAINVLRPIVERGDFSVSVDRRPRNTKPTAVPVSVRRSLAEAYFGLGEYQNACRQLRTIMSDEPSDAAAWCLFARSAMMVGDGASADEALTRFHARNKPTSESLLLSGYISLSLGDFRQAEIAADKALALDRTSESAWLLKAAALRELGAMGDALEALKNAIAATRGSAASIAMQSALADEAREGGFDISESSIRGETGARSTVLFDKETDLP